jgi:hypothetical protein
VSTTTGTTAGRAPARGHHLPAAALAAVAVAMLLVLPEYAGDQGRLAVVLVVQLGLVLAWVVVTALPGFVGSLAVGAAAAVAADLWLLLPERPELAALLGVLGLGFLAVVVQQMSRRDRRGLVAALSGALLMVSSVCALSTFLLLEGPLSGPGGIGLLAAGAALVVAHLVDLVLPRPQVADGVPRGLAGLLAAVAAGTAVGLLADADTTFGRVAALIEGGAVGLVTALVGLAASYVVVEAELAEAESGAADHPDAGWRRLALPLIQAVLPLAASAPATLALQTVL